MYAYNRLLNDNSVHMADIRIAVTRNVRTDVFFLKCWLYGLKVRCVIPVPVPFVWVAAGWAYPQFAHSSPIPVLVKWFD